MLGKAHLVAVVNNRLNINVVKLFIVEKARHLLNEPREYALVK